MTVQEVTKLFNTAPGKKATFEEQVAEKIQKIQRREPTLSLGSLLHPVVFLFHSVWNIFSDPSNDQDAGCLWRSGIHGFRRMEQGGSQLRRRVLRTLVPPGFLILVIFFLMKTFDSLNWIKQPIIVPEIIAGEFPPLRLLSRRFQGLLPAGGRDVQPGLDPAVPRSGVRGTVELQGKLLRRRVLARN